jgi:hypothetical protein
VYFLRDDAPNGYAGVTGCWGKPSFMGRQSYTFNKPQILDMIIRRLFPDMHRELTMLAMQEGTSGAVETLRRVIQNQLEDPDKQTLRDMFADCGRTDFGKSTELVKYIRHNKRNIETIGNEKKKPVQMELFDESTEGHEQE